MTPLGRYALVLDMVTAIEARGGWCGETHVQKSVYLLKQLTAVPVDYRYILYKYGPYSFTLRDELVEMRARRLLSLVPQPAPYGPSVRATPLGRELTDRFDEAKRVVERYKLHVRFIVDNVGTKRVAELEQLGTAMLLMSKWPDAQPSQIAEKLHKVKPHVSKAAASGAVDSVRKLLEDWERTERHSA